jgi:hypothetical protein
MDRGLHTNNATAMNVAVTQPAITIVLVAESEAIISR